MPRCPERLSSDTARKNLFRHIAVAESHRHTVKEHPLGNSGSYRKGLVLTSVASMTSPVIGLVTAPLMAQALGVDGRGAVSAALAPNLLIVTIAAFGIPDSVAYYLAAHHADAKRIFLLAIKLSALPAAIGVVLGWLLSPTVASDQHELIRIMEIATLLALPALLLGLIRAVAVGKQLWTLIALERVLSSVFKLIALLGFWWAGHLTVNATVYISVLTPVAAGIVYVAMLRRGSAEAESQDDGDPDGVQHETTEKLTRELFGYSRRVWVGGLSIELMARVPSLVVAPLSSFAQLGLLVVANTIADLPNIVVGQVQVVVFGSSSAERNENRLMATSAGVFMVAALGGLALGATLPWWITPLFGAGFHGAIVPTWLSLAGSAFTVPGLVTGAGLAAWNRPGLRSVAQFVGLVTLAVTMVLLVPPYGAIGASISGLATAVSSTMICVVGFARITKRPVLRFFIPTIADTKLAIEMTRRLLTRGRGTVSAEN